MHALCTACSDSPGGMDGHPDLLVETMGEARMCFRCQGCQSLWLRTPSGADSFSWVELRGRALRLNGDLVVPPLSAARWGT